MERPVTFENQGQQIVGILHMPERETPAPGVVLCHGFTGTKSEAHWIFVKLARRLAAEGMAVLRFDFRGSGDSAGEFKDVTISGEVSDARRAVEFLAEQPGVERTRLGIVGLSLGGCVAASVAGESPLIGATVLWAPVHDPDVVFARFLPEHVAFPHEFAPGMLLGRAFVDELPHIDPVATLTKTRGPVLILHGANDQSLPPDLSTSYAEALKAAGVPCEREVIEGADHTFSGVKDEQIVIERTVGWLRKHLAAGAAAPVRKATYADAGVDIARASVTKEKLKALVRQSYTPQVLGDLGAFGGLFAAEFPGVADPVLVASTDSVGTKLKVAVMANKHDTVGADIVNHCVNDILVMGARPLFFLDYIGMGRHSSHVVLDIVAGVARACAKVGCALIGGETAELPDMYRPGEYDLAGTVVGVVGRSRILQGDEIAPGDMVIGLGSDGLHTNGYSLARKLCFEQAGWTVDTYIPEWNATVAEALLRPHRCYLNPLAPLLADGLIRGMAHITGGGITDNLARILPEGTAAHLRRDAWPVPPIFRTLVELGRMDPDEAYRTFNMGVGMTLVVASAHAERVMERLSASGERVWRIGHIAGGSRSVHYE